MEIVEWYFGFHPRTTVRKAWADRQWSFVTHVEAWGYTNDKTWFFFDPRAAGTKIKITHHYDEVNENMALKFEHCRSILKLPPISAEIGVPLHPTMNCASQCGHLLGIRAYTPHGLHRILLKNGAKELLDHGTKGRSGG